MAVPARLCAPHFDFHARRSCASCLFFYLVVCMGLFQPPLFDQVNLMSFPLLFLGVPIFKFGMSPIILGSFFCPFHSPPSFLTEMAWGSWDYSFSWTSFVLSATLLLFMWGPRFVSSEKHCSLLSQFSAPRPFAGNCGPPPFLYIFIVPGHCVTRTSFGFRPCWALRSLFYFCIFSFSDFCFVLYFFFL